MRETGDPGCDNGGVSPTPAQQAQAARIAAELAALGFALPGTLADRMTRCGRANCRCHADPPRRHGPYHQWTRKKNGRTATRILTDDQLADYQPLVRQPPPAPRAHHRTRGTQPRHRRSRPPLEPLATLPDASAAAAPQNRNDSLQIVWAARA
jgi:hypothetical protein